jgi:predicted nuclease of restriction endonuclease-like (RecB) superfamily
MSDKPVRLTASPEGYADWLAELKARIHGAQQRATLAVNRELVLLYWQIGRDILTRQGQQGWGAKVIERLSQDLRTAFPEMKGFSPRNLKYMRAFAEAWPDEKFVQEVLAQLPWGHNLVLLDRLSTPEERRWYAAQALESLKDPYRFDFLGKAAKPVRDENIGNQATMPLRAKRSLSPCAKSLGPESFSLRAQ